MVSKFAEERFMEEILDILGVVEGGGGSRRLRGFLLVTWLSWIDT